MPRLTIASTIRQGIAQGLSDSAILVEVARRHVGARTTYACVAYYRTEARRLARGLAPRARTVAANPTDIDALLPYDGSVASMLADRGFGIEVEFHGNGRTLSEFADAIRAALPASERVVNRGSYCHSDGTAWDLKYDGSCEFELATPRLTRATWPNFVAALDAIKALGGTVATDCGVHVHHETRVRGRRSTWHVVRAILRTWAVFDEPIHNALPFSRRQNSYCRRIDASWAYGTWMNDGVGVRRSVRNAGRYLSLNATGWWRTGRVEVRAHHGSLDAEKIGRWVAVTQRIIGHAIRDAATTERNLAGFAAWTDRDRHARFVALIEGNGDLPTTVDDWTSRRSPHYHARVA